MTFVADHRVESAPRLPIDRPLTKREVWEVVSYTYEGVKTEQEMKAFALGQWVWSYVKHFNNYGWRKQPDWTEREPVWGDCVPGELFLSGSASDNARIVQACWERAEAHRKALRRAA